MTFESVFQWMSNLIKSKAKSEEISECLRDLAYLVSDKGLEKRLLDQCWRKILLFRSQRLILDGIHLMVPSDEILQDTLDFLLIWIVDGIRSESSKELVIKAILQWLTCAIHRRVMCGRSIQHSYYVLLSLLSEHGYANEICHLLYYLTEPHLVTPYSVKRLLSLKFPKKNYSHAALLSLYKRLKPHLVKEAVTYENDLEIYPCFSRNIYNCFEAATRAGGLRGAEKRCRYPNWRLQTIAYKRRKLDSVVYLSEMTLVEAVREAQASDLFTDGSQFESLLFNPYGFIFLALADRQVQERMQIYIEKELERNKALFFRDETDDFADFLQSLSRLQNVYGQTIEAVDEFVKKILTMWSGVLYTKHVFGLICHLVISDYTEFFGSILKPLYLLNVKFRDKEFAKYTIRSLAKCFMHNVDNLKNPKQILQSKTPLKPNRDAIQKYRSSFQHLCVFFVNVFPRNSEILHEIVDNHISFSIGIKESDFQENLLPNPIIHKILINSDFMLVNKFCMIEAAHVKNFIHKSRKTGDFSIPETIRGHLLDLATIYFKSILRTRFFEEADVEFRSIDDQIAAKFSDIRYYFRTRSNFTFMPLTRFDSEGKYITEFNQAVHKDMIRTHCPDFAELTNMK